MMLLKKSGFVFFVGAVLALTLMPETIHAESPPEHIIKKTVADFEEYQGSKEIFVDRGAIRVKPNNDLGWYIVVIAGDEGDPGQSDLIVLTLPGAAVMSGYAFREVRKKSWDEAGDSMVASSWQTKGDSIRLALTHETWGWYFLRKPLPTQPAVAPSSKTASDPVIAVPGTDLQKARYPVVDVHTHLTSRRRDAREQLKVMDQVGVAILVDSPLAYRGFSTEHAFHAYEEKHPDRFLTFATIDFAGRFEEGFAAKAVAKLESDVETMAVPGIGETHDKGSGLFGHAFRPERRGAVHIDDQRVMPIWRAAARLKLPVLFHLADPIQLYAPPGGRSLLSRGPASPTYNLWGTASLSRDEMMKKRDFLMEQIPDLVIIGAHMGTQEDDLARLGESLDKYPNLYVEIGVRHIALGLQPRTARKFFIKYQGRILFGQDGVQSVKSYRTHFRLLETDDDLIVFTSDRPPVYGLHLPDEVLRKVYYANAAKLMPRVKEALMKQYPDLVFP